jgi:hypothetical protein
MVDTAEVAYSSLPTTHTTPTTNKLNSQHADRFRFKTKKSLLARICVSDPRQLGISGYFFRCLFTSRRASFSIVRYFQLECQVFMDECNIPNVVR